MYGDAIVSYREWIELPHLAEGGRLPVSRAFVMLKHNLRATLMVAAETSVAFRFAKDAGFRGAKGNHATLIDLPQDFPRPCLTGVAPSANVTCYDSDHSGVGN
jgi:hypothetical protein